MKDNKTKASTQVEEVQDSEFMLEPVHKNKRRSTRSQVMVWIGFGYAVTGLIVGGNLAGYGGTGGLPPLQAFLAIVLGMALCS